jgi:hypothetical protein
MNMNYHKVTEQEAEDFGRCSCAETIDAGDMVSTITGTLRGEKAEWIECPNCNSARCLVESEMPETLD